MSSCILLSHVFIREGETSKIEQVVFSVQHFRKNNPNAYIILTGHGMKPVDAFQYVDYVYWSDTIIEKEINVGHPYLVNVGYEHAQDKKFTHVCKSRSDGIHLIEDLLSFSHECLGDKNILVTQQTKFNTQHMGDLYMYGNIDFLRKCWNYDTWYPTSTGLVSLANNFLQASESSNWVESLKSNCSFRDIFTLRWIDFRANWETLRNRKEELISNSFSDWYRYLWGSTENWHVFDDTGNVISSCIEVVTEKDWYQ